MFAALIFLGVGMTNAWAGQIEMVLGKEPITPPEAGFSPVQELEVEEEIRSPGIKIEANPIVRVEGLRLLGQGLTASLPKVISAGGDIVLSGRFWRVGGGLNVSTYFGLPTEVTPNTITSRDWHADVLFRFLKLGTFEFEAGYQFFGRAADSTTPQVLVTSFWAQGPSLSVASKWRIGKWRISSRLGVSIPWHYAETDNSSGSFRFSTRAVVNALASYEVLRNFSVGAGLDLFFQALVFSGSGSRGTTNASELTYGVGIPLVIQYEF